LHAYYKFGHCFAGHFFHFNLYSFVFTQRIPFFKKKKKKKKKKKNNLRLSTTKEVLSSNLQASAGDDISGLAETDTGTILVLPPFYGG